MQNLCTCLIVSNSCSNSKWRERGGTRSRAQERERSDYSISRKSLLIFNRNRTSLKSAANLNRDSIRRITNRWEEEDFFINRGNSWEINFDFFFSLYVITLFGEFNQVWLIKLYFFKWSGRKKLFRTDK